VLNDNKEGKLVAKPEQMMILRAFEAPDEVREFEKGRFEIVHIGGMSLGRATYQPGWRWSLHVGPKMAAARCEVEHLGYVVSGVATSAFADGRVVEMNPGQLFYIPPEPHDSWVVGDQPYISLHFIGATHYAR
jgi:quercetin dioxygenase-like cupin family protein